MHMHPRSCSCSRGPRRTANEPPFGGDGRSRRGVETRDGDVRARREKVSAPGVDVALRDSAGDGVPAGTVAESEIFHEEAGQT